MRMSSSVKSIWLLLAVLAIVSALVAIGVQSSPDEGQPVAKPSRIQQVRLSLAKLFDFEFYKKVFHKNYTSVVEQMVRAKYYMARALKVSLAAFKYVHHKQSHYLSINHMSDETAGERLMGRNKFLDEKYADYESEVGSDTAGENSAENNDGDGDDDDNDLLTNIPDLGENPYETLVELLDARKSNPRYAQMLEALRELQQDSSRPDEAGEIVQHLMKQRRSKRSVTSETRRVLPFRLLMKSGPDSSRSEPDSFPKNINQTSNSPVEEQSGPKLMSDPQDLLEARIYNHGLTPGVWQAKRRLLDRFRYRQVQKILKSTSTKLPDEVFLDHRDTKCLFLPRSQGTCGSCYAFAAVSMIEYLYCRKTGQLVAFSEQFVVDCGKKYQPDLIFGCDGGVDIAAVSFLDNVGLELRKIYPYRVREDICPYEAKLERDRAGFIKVDMKGMWLVKMADFEEVLLRTPIMVVVKTPNDFREYGGGVHTCRNNVYPEGWHSMVLIGHGIEDNQEYWLMRNSFSVGWGEGGHFKLLKNAPCLRGHGFIFGTSDSKNFDFIVKPNNKYDEHRVQILHIVNSAKDGTK